MQNKADITMLLDRTGSMGRLKSEVVPGYNTFIEEQKKVDSPATFTLVQFDSVDPQEVVHDAIDIQNVPVMKMEDFQPRALTPLLDALGQAIVRTGERLKKIPEGDRPDKVIFVVFTDGEENASKEYSAESIKDMVKQQENIYNWDFIFMGADIDAFAQAGNAGISAATTMDVSGQNAAVAMAFTTSNVASYRTSGAKRSLKYTDEQRRKAK